MTTDPAGTRPRLFSARCSTCIFRPGNRMRLEDGRLADVVAQNRAAGAVLICHKTTYGQAPDLGEVMCRGYFDAYGSEATTVQVMERLFGPDWYEVVDPPTDAPAPTTDRPRSPRA